MTIKVAINGFGRIGRMVLRSFLFKAKDGIRDLTVTGVQTCALPISEKWRFSVRVAPDRFLELTGMPGIKPARYMGRYHWITIVKVDSVPDDYLAELVEWSYRKEIGRASCRESV